jgi:cell division protein ZapE
MQEVHKRLHAARQSDRQDAIAPVAKAIAREARLLCLDEMQITDIADAMIVGRLFEGLLAYGTVIVTTSNLKPDDLYRNGLNRQLFEPFISLIGERLDVVSLDSLTDYRLGRVKAHETFLTPLSPETDARLQDLWVRLTDTEQGLPREIEVLGRKLLVPEASGRAARFSFAELCEQPLGPPDYLALAQNFQVLFLEHIPALNPDRRNEALEPPIIWSVNTVERGNGFVVPGDYWVLVNTTERLQQLRLTDAKWAEVRLPDVRAGEELAVDADGWMPALAPFEVRILGPIPTR